MSHTSSIDSYDMVQVSGSSLFISLLQYSLSNCNQNYCNFFIFNKTTTVTMENY